MNTNPLTEALDSHGELEALHGSGIDRSIDSDLDSRLSGCDFGDLLDDSDAGTHWRPEADLPLALLGDEDPLALSLDRIAQLRDAAEGAVSVPRRRGPVQALSHTLKFDEEDFEEGTERDAFLIVKGFAERLFQPRSIEDIESSIRWFFTFDAPGEVSFELCCRVLEARPEVFRLRCHYEFFLRDVMFTRPLPFTTVPVPLVISRELAYFPGELGKHLANCAWRQPGIEHPELLSYARAAFSRDDEQFGVEVNRALDYMESKYYMSHQHGWYTTGRNPMRYRQDGIARLGRGWELIGGTLSWSRLFGRD